MKKRDFDLTSDSRILIYGCGDMGQSMAQELIKKKYNVVAFLDKNAAEIREWENIPVIDFDQLKSNVCFEEYIVFVMLHNGMSHEKIAFKCFQCGIENIVYLPMHVYYSYAYRYDMRRIYKFLSNYEFDFIKNVPKYELPDTNRNALKLIDIYPSGNIAFWCPVDILHAPSLELVDHLHSAYQQYAYQEYSLFQECKIKDLMPYVQLFEWLKGENINIDAYLRYTGRYSEELRGEWLAERKELYKIYLDALKYDLTFFTDAPSPCVWNSKGYFVLIEGLTRASFLISEGYAEVPVCISEDDYNAWREYDLQAGNNNLVRRV